MRLSLWRRRGTGVDCKKNNQGEWVRYNCDCCKGHVITDPEKIMLAEILYSPICLCVWKPRDIKECPKHG